MIKKVLFIFTIVLIPLLTFAQETLNIGLVKGLWFSQDNYFAGDEIKVNGAFFNDSSSNIKGEVVFYVDNKEFYRGQINIKPNVLKQIQAPYLAKEGKHVFEAKVISAVRINDDGSEEGVFVKTNLILGEETLTVDLDTDGDGVGNKLDSDDDGDGYSDEIESQNGTDPLSDNDFPKIGKDLEENEISRQEEVQRIIDDLQNTATDLSDKTSGFISSALERLNERNLTEIKKESETWGDPEPAATSSGNAVVRIVTSLDNVRESVEKSISFKLLERTKQNVVLDNQETPESVESEVEKKGFSYHFLNIMFYIFKSAFLAILFLLLLTWILWKFLFWVLLLLRRRGSSDDD